MLRSPRTTRALASLALLCCLAPLPARAQGLLWSLPDEGTWVRYEGDYEHVQFDPTTGRQLTIEDARANYDCDGPEIDYANVICWRRSIELRALGVDLGMFRGEQVPCRWVEIKTVTGEPTETGIDPGPTGTRIVRVLIPEPAVVGDTVDGRGIPVAFTPILKGYQKIGEGDVTTLDAGVLQLYPAFTLVAQYRTLTKDDTAGDPGLLIDAGATTAFTGETTTESRTDRSVNTATLWRSDTIPFGLAAWNVTLIREKKDAVVDRSRFVPRSRITVEMKATATGNDAVGELAIPAGG